MRLAPIRVFLSGGLGNQLFQWIQGLKYQNLLKRDVVFDTSLLHRYRVPRKFELTELIGEAASSISFPLIKYLPALRHVPFQHVVLVGDGNHQVAPEQIRPSTRFVLGYFQDLALADELKDQIWEAFSNSPSFSQLLPTRVMDRICIHIRRGDLVFDPKAKRFHGLSEDSYFVNAAIRMREVSSLNNILIVSDDIEEGIHKVLLNLRRQNFEVTVSKSGQPALADLALISNSSAVITSNSSYSWWGAWLSSRFARGLVVIPSPWFSVVRPDEKLLYASDWLVERREIAT